MQSRSLAFLLALVLLLSATPVLAGQPAPGADLPGFSLLVGYDGSYLYYVERSSPYSKKIDKDYGWMNGGFAQARYDTEQAFVRLRGEGATTTSATYDGALWSGAPWKQDTHETIFKVEGDVGYKLYSQDGLTFAPYLGLGYRDWKRGEDVLPSYKEDYHWWFGALGMNLNYRTGKWTLGLDAAVFMPFAMEMKTDVAGTFDMTKFKIRSLPGVRLETPVSYEVASGQSGTLSVFCIPYYEKWEIGKSPNVTMTKNGVATATVAYEPKSTSDIFGVRLGLGVKF